MSKQLVIFPRGSVSPKDKERMSKEGFLAVEADDPSKVIMPLPCGDTVTGNMMLEAALHGLSSSNAYGERQTAWNKLAELVRIKLSKTNPK